MENNELSIYDENYLKLKIYIIRGVQVMIDRDLADIYGVKTGRLNEQVKRNIERFPEDFCFQLTKEEFENWKSQNAISNSDKMGLRKSPYAFTELGVAMLATVLKTETASATSVKIIRAFVAMRHIVINNAHFGEKMDLALAKHNSQYQPITIEHFNKSHDRFLIIDNDVYLIGGSIKDLGKKVSTFVKLSIPKGEFLAKLLNFQL